MGNSIPYFYADLIARIVPGSVLISLISLTTLNIPKPWTDFVSNLGSSAQAVLIPILLAGVAYVFGTVLESLLNPILEKIYIFAFNNALSKEIYTRLYQSPERCTIETIRTAKDLSRATFGHLISSPSDREKQSIPHIVRFHSEAKMCFATSTMLFIFLIFACVDTKTTNQLISKEILNDPVWSIIIGFLLITLAATTYQRLLTRAMFVMRTIERSAAESDSSDATKKLRDELFAFCDLKRKGQTSNKANSADAKSSAAD